MIAAFNALPRTADTTEGFFSRWVVVPFSAFFPAGIADPGLIDRLTRYTELQGLLRQAVGGLQQVMRRGAFTLPPSVLEATERFRMEADPIRGFISEKLDSSNGFVERTEVYSEYTMWSALNGFHQMSATRFYEQLQMVMVDAFDYPVRAAIRDGTRGYVGLRIRK